MKNMLLTREERTQAVLDGFRGLPEEFGMLKAFLCAGAAIEKACIEKGFSRESRSAERDALEPMFNMLMIVGRIDELRGIAAKDYAARKMGQEGFEAEYSRLFRWRAVWTRLATDVERARRRGGRLQVVQDRIERRARVADRKIGALFAQIDKRS